MLNELNLEQFKYIRETYINSNQLIYSYIHELSEDNWIEIIDTNDSIDKSKVVQCYKGCELVDTKILYMYDINKFETNVNNIINEIYKGEN